MTPVSEAKIQLDHSSASYLELTYINANDLKWFCGQPLMLINLQSPHGPLGATIRSRRAEYLRLGFLAPAVSKTSAP
jgi:hypothetical protein